MTDKKIPFVGLHAHSVAGSIFDAIGYPNEHMDFFYGKEFKPIFGVEAYFLPSIDEWREDYERIKEDKKLAKSLAKQGDTSGATVEDEDASKKAIKSVINRRRHLVLLAQNQTGLNNLFKLISESYKEENFYRYPRVDYKLLDKYSEGVIAASACLGGPYAGNYWANREEGPEAVLEAMRETSRQFVKIFGDRWYGELQWNNITEQHELNQYIIKVCKGNI